MHHQNSEVSVRCYLLCNSLCSVQIVHPVTQNGCAEIACQSKVLHLARLLRIHRHNLHSVCVDGWRALAVEFEVNVADDKGPHVVTEAINVKPTLELQPCLDSLLQHVGDYLVKVFQHANRNLWLDPALGYELIQCFDKSIANTACPVKFVIQLVACHIE